ncbi:MAG: response regulator [Elusimicrobia bacterium]|nr:response regulator [Elusimicrobiota bacterium]
MPRSIYWKLLLAIVPVVVLAVGAMVWLQYDQARDRILAAIDREIALLARRAAGGIDDILARRYEDLFTVSETPLIADYYHTVEFDLINEARTYRNELEKYLLAFYWRSRAYSLILYLDDRGREVCRIERGLAARPGASAGREDCFARVKGLAPGRWWVSPLRELEGVGPVLYYARPVHDELGRFKGAFVLCYDLSHLLSMLGQIDLGGGGRAFLLTETGARLGSPAGPDAGRVLRAESRLGSMPWAVVLESPMEDFLGPLKEVRNAAIATSFAGLALLTGVILFLVGSVTRPVAALVAAAREIGSGNLSHRIGRERTDELGILAAAFNDMAAKLEEHGESEARLRDQLVQAEKLSAAGQLISSVAHEINNPLAAVSGYAQMVLLDGCPERMRADLENLNRNVKRCRKVVDNLLMFLRRSRKEHARVRVHEAARSALDMLRYRLVKTEDVVVVEEFAAELPDVAGDFQQIVQVLVNLVGNACDAMAAVSRYPDPRRLTIRTRADERRVTIEVEDNGPGVPEELRGRLFEPFFTTKEPGRGTGLGLAISRQIVEGHGGEMSFECRAGQGCVFRVRLPAAGEAELAALDEPAALAVPAPVPGRRVLVVDDEADIAELIGRVMAADGDEVEVAHHGGQALRKVRERDYDLVISDIEMEAVKGQDVFAELAKRRSDALSRILFVTGDILNPGVLEFLSKTKAEYLVKPFEVPDLQRAARRLLSKGLG